MVSWFRKRKKASSLPDKIEAIYTAFYNDYSDGIVSDIFEDHIIVKLSWNDKGFYKISYTFDDDKCEVTLAPVQDWISGEFIFQESKAIGFKILNDDKWVAIWSNSFIDKEGEIFSHKSHLDYIDWVNARGEYEDSEIHMPELWLLHVPGTKIGQAVFVEDHGLFQIAVGTFDDSEIANKARENLIGLNLSVSHGFVSIDKKDGIYNKYRTFEISPLPRGWEANEYTNFDLGEENMDAKTKEKLVDLLGEELVDEITDKLSETEAGLKAAGVAFKTDAVDAKDETINEALALVVERLDAMGVRLDSIESKMYTPKNALFGTDFVTKQGDLEPVDSGSEEASFIDKVFDDLVGGVE